MPESNCLNMNETCQGEGMVDSSCESGKNAFQSRCEHYFYWDEILNLKLFRCLYQIATLNSDNCNKSTCRFGIKEYPSLLICTFSRGFSLFSPDNSMNIGYLLAWVCQGNARSHESRLIHRSIIVLAE
jgi:hypothetical protein